MIVLWGKIVFFGVFISSFHEKVVTLHAIWA